MLFVLEIDTDNCCSTSTPPNIVEIANITSLDLISKTLSEKNKITYIPFKNYIIKKCLNFQYLCNILYSKIKNVV